jgi:hypothetical protein
MILIYIPNHQHTTYQQYSTNAAAPNGATPNSSGQPALSTGDMWVEYVGVAIVLGAAAAWCGVWLTVLLKNAGNMIKCVMHSSIDLIG